MKINEIVIKLGQVDNTQAKAFMAAFDQISQPHPTNHRKRVLNNVMVELNIIRNKIHITDILTHDRGKGNMSRTMDTLKQLADEYHVMLELTAYGYDDVSTDDLVRIYTKMGFSAGDESDGGIDMAYYPA